MGEIIFKNKSVLYKLHVAFIESKNSLNFKNNCCAKLKFIKISKTQLFNHNLV